MRVSDATVQADAGKSWLVDADGLLYVWGGSSTFTGQRAGDLAADLMA